ncbi:hypothetical protein BS47DRAFT_1291079 [Hydnum rufescens UP504]|uniref:Protein kinase domain-containing protein n=1 Tax=Hydnum rufescens UP504 TaxID=1448309 RepID=A0A9P6DZW1_9AGAM|nr:hypothetical protein BS47DRAFT_1291079 [Hydnum rufescens UP504]
MRDGDPLLPEKQFLLDAGSNVPRTPSGPDVERLFRPLIPYLSATDPLERFSDLTQVAEGQFGPVFAARAIDVGVAPSSPSAKFGSLVAVKTIRVEDEGSPKVEALAIELEVMSQVRHMHILATAGLFVRGDTLWVEMELMERSLADMLPLIEDGLVITEPEVARFASDILSGLAYLEGLSIAHRDVRSDNLLLSRIGILKLADFSHAVVTQRNELFTSVIPVPPYWMAPEMRLGRPYNAHLVDVWSVGATIWEIIEGSPPFLDIEDPSDFGDRWPPLQRANEFSVSLHQFLRLCSEMDDWRPHPDELLDTPFVQGACPRREIVTLLAEVRLLEDGLGDR